MSGMNLAEQVKEQIATLSVSLEQRLPNMPQLLRTIHNNLKVDAEIVTLLSADEIRVVIQSLERQKNTVLTTAAMASKKKPLKQLTIDDM